MKPKTTAFLLLLCCSMLLVPASLSVEIPPDQALREAFQSGSIVLRSRAFSGASTKYAPFSISPDGKTAISLIESGTYVVGSYSADTIIPDTERSVPDTYGSFARFLEKIKPTAWAGKEDVAWSPDGRYAAFSNVMLVNRILQFVYGLYVIDTQTHSLLCLETYPYDFPMDVASVYQMRFDETGRYLYYIVFHATQADGIVQTLLRYDMETDERETLLTFGPAVLNPQLQLDSQGRLWNPTWTQKSKDYSGLNLFSPQDGAWTLSQFPLPLPASELSLSYMELAQNDWGVTLIEFRKLSNVLGSGFYLPGRFSVGTGEPVGYNEVLLIKGYDAEMAEALPLGEYTEEYLEDLFQNNNLLVCRSIKLSPDGRYAMMLVGSRIPDQDHGQCSFLMMDLETLELCHVAVPELETLMFAAMDSPRYAPGFNWFPGNLFTIGTPDGVKLFTMETP